MCLERAKLAGIPVCDWEISQGYVPLPAIIYGLNYFATSADFFVVNDGEHAKEVTGHVTNKGKYPFCYQKIPIGATIHYLRAASLGGLPTPARPSPAWPGRYTKSFPSPWSPWFLSGPKTSTCSPPCPRQNTPGFSGDEKALLTAYLSHQEFL